MTPVFKGLNASSPNVPDCSPCHNGNTEISWKAIHPFYGNVARRHVAAPRWGTVKESSLVKYETVRVIAYFVVPDISWKIQENPLTRFSMISITNTNAKIVNPIPDSRGSPNHPENVTDCSLSHVKPFLKELMKIRSSVLLNVAHIDGFPWENICL